MGRRYYCDYCDKNFIDDLDARKKHLQSAQHIKNRNLHYEAQRDPETIFREESLKMPCRRFLLEGFCQFEGNCKYSHYSPDQLYEISQLVEYNKEQKRKKEQELVPIPSVESWHEKYSETFSKSNVEVVNTFWDYPANLETRLDLPPSLQKFKPGQFTSDNFEEWG
ncbi:unnamed protein product [Brassicogethes aeneus]|uniref:C3H1-type domain-containing protein n=1 Tax=Brassicogethes aeneus TaxID=1431903 RepID=A0A9P0ALS1_BRAAE|nr:unnamed protein product [Brassicogethes aeneus]